MALMDRLKTVLDVGSNMLVVVAAAAVLWTQFKEPAAAVQPGAIRTVKEVLAAKHLTNVSGSGPIAIVEFSDFQCPFCARHANETLPILKQKLKGRARYIVVNLPLPIHADALAAAEAAECAAEQDTFWPMHALLFKEQASLATAHLIDFASRLKLDATQFTSCLNRDDALAKVKADEAEARRLGISSTPTLFIGRMRSDGGADLLKRIRGAMPADMIIDEVAEIERGG